MVAQTPEVLAKTQEFLPIREIVHNLGFLAVESVDKVCVFGQKFPDVVLVVGYPLNAGAKFSQVASELPFPLLAVTGGLSANSQGMGKKGGHDAAKKGRDDEFEDFLIQCIAIACGGALGGWFYIAFMADKVECLMGRKWL